MCFQFPSSVLQDWLTLMITFQLECCLGNVFWSFDPIFTACVSELFPQVDKYFHSCPSCRSWSYLALGQEWIWKLGTRQLRWDCTVQCIMFCGINGAAGVWVNLLGWNVWASLVLWYGNCPVCYSNSLWPVFSLLGVFCHWWFWVGLLYLFWNDCRLCCSLPNQWTMKCVSFSGSVLQSVWYTYSPGQWCALLWEQMKGVVSSLPDPSELPSPLFFFLFLFFNLQFF